jgi:hypothetical protein
MGAMHKGGKRMGQSAPQECNTACQDQGYGLGVCALGHVLGKSHMMEQNWIIMLGVTSVMV